ncbi:hypothetical protein THAOC_30532, partial [Thalassiosira oceanica]
MLLHIAHHYQGLGQKSIQTTTEAGQYNSQPASYVRAERRLYFPIFKQSNGDFQKFQEQATSSDLLSGIDDATSLNDDEAYEMAASAWFEVRNSLGGTREDAVFQFVDYLKLIQARAKGFSFKLAEDTSGKKKTLLGVLWMTATMRRNFELYGDYISLDMMKRGLNTLLWPYIGVAMYDNMKKVCLACEGTLCG